MALKKVETDFGNEYIKTNTKILLIIMLLALYKNTSKERSIDNVYLLTENPDLIKPSEYMAITIAVNSEVLAMLKEQYSSSTYSEIIEYAISDYLQLPLSFYTNCIPPLYTIVGSKNTTMQSATTNAVENMNLNYEATTLIDGCCATGSLFFGLKTYPWKKVILNDLNPLRTNFLNVLKKKPLELIIKIIMEDFEFIDKPETKNPIISEYKMATNEYSKERANYKKVDCNVEIAYKMFILQCIDKKWIDKGDKIIRRSLTFLPAHLKLRDATITQLDCLKYLKNDDAEKLVLLDVPYVGSEHTCSVANYRYEPFHKKVAKLLSNASYSFLYYCRSTAPKSQTAHSKEDAEHIMKIKLATYFMNRGYYFQKVHLEKDTELMISNQRYDTIEQFLWNDMSVNIL